ncbi:centromere-associated protein E-like [Eulemur rufifrons]|uniref:centromere-associated protein E-like n=1 Tax=Eulemur rufifrons TaxID=859984 RepID=UPI003744534F
MIKNYQNHEEAVKCEKMLLSDGQQHLTESLKEKRFRIEGLLKRYSEMNNHYECLNGLSLDLETEIEFHKIIKKFKCVLSCITKMKEEQHESINKFEMDFIGEVEKQNKLLIKIQHLQQDCDVPSKEFRDLKLNQNMDLHMEEILKDFSESDFPSIKTEFQQVLSNRKEMTQFLEEWLNTHCDIEKLKNGIQKENDRICQVNYFFNNKIILPFWLAGGCGWSPDSRKKEKLTREKKMFLSPQCNQS